MRKVACLVGISALFLSGCVMTSGNAIVGMISTDVAGPSVITSAANEVTVEGRATASGIFGVVSGDCSYEAALKDAFSKTEATEVDPIFRTKIRRS